MYNVEKCQNGVNTARFLKYVWSFFDILHEKTKGTYVSISEIQKQNQVYAAAAILINALFQVYMVHFNTSI